jgi:hypothetical protein
MHIRLWMELSVVFFTNIDYKILNSVHIFTFTFSHTHINYSVFYLNFGISLIIVPRQLFLNYKNQTVLIVELNSKIQPKLHRQTLRIMSAALRAVAIYRLMDCRHLVYKHVTIILVLLLTRYNEYYMCKYLERVVRVNGSQELLTASTYML